MVKLHLGAQIDGFASISAETIVIGASAENPVTGRRADALKAAWTAAEVAMRTVKVGNKNWSVTEAVSRVASTWNCKPVEGELRIVNIEGKTLTRDLFFLRHVVVSADSKCD